MVQAQSGRDLRDDISRAVVSNGWSLRGMQMVGMSLGGDFPEADHPGGPVTMRTVQAVAWKEIQIYFLSPTAYIVGLIFLALTGFFFSRDLGDPFPEATLSPFFQGSIVIFILLAPALTMRLIAEESKLGTIELLLTSPVRDWEVVLGKYVASLVFFLALVAVSAFYAVLLFVFASPGPRPDICRLPGTGSHTARPLCPSGCSLPP